MFRAIFCPSLTA